MCVAIGTSAKERLAGSGTATSKDKITLGSDNHTTQIQRSKYDSSNDATRTTKDEPKDDADTVKTSAAYYGKEIAGKYAATGNALIRLQCVPVVVTAILASNVWSATADFGSDWVHAEKGVLCVIKPMRPASFTVGDRYRVYSAANAASVHYAFPTGERKEVFILTDLKPATFMEYTNAVAHGATMSK